MTSREAIMVGGKSDSKCQSAHFWNLNGILIESCVGTHIALTSPSAQSISTFSNSPTTPLALASSTSACFPATIAASVPASGRKVTMPPKINAGHALGQPGSGRWGSCTASAFPPFPPSAPSAPPPPSASVHGRANDDQFAASPYVAPPPAKRCCQPASFLVGGPGAC